MNFERTIILRKSYVDITKNAERALIMECISILSEQSHNGWVCKKLEDIADDCLIYVSKSTMSRHMKTLVKLGVVEERPVSIWDKTKEYRINKDVVSDLLKESHTETGVENSIQNETDPSNSVQNETSVKSMANTQNTVFHNDTIDKSDKKIDNRYSNDISSILKHCKEKSLDKLGVTDIVTLLSMHTYSEIIYAIDRATYGGRVLTRPFYYLSRILSNLKKEAGKKLVMTNRYVNTGNNYNNSANNQNQYIKPFNQKNKFMNFTQRQYSKSDFKSIEQMLLMKTYSNAVL